MKSDREIYRLDEALDRSRNFALKAQRPDGSWSSSIGNDPRVTAFYMNALWNLGRAPDSRTAEMESYLSSQQLECGGWESWPGSGPDINVTAICAFALRDPTTNSGRHAQHRAKLWLSKQPLPTVDSFWKGYLAFNGKLRWEELPYLTPRVVSNPSWLHPNVYDFSFLRAAIVATILIQQHSNDSSTVSVQSKLGVDSEDIDDAFDDWMTRWIHEARRPVYGILGIACRLMRAIDCVFPPVRDTDAAIEWLLRHQESDGSFFSSVHMTTIAVVALHHVDPERFRRQIQAGIDAMHNWQIVGDDGRIQCFTDGTTWDTILCTDLLRMLGTPQDHLQMILAREFIHSAHNEHHGDWSHRTPKPRGGGWSFQRVGKWYPDCDDTVMAVSTLLELDPNSDHPDIRSGVEWLLTMQCSNGGWASWDRNDRWWIAIPNGGPWFARDLPATEITARILILFSRISKGRYPALHDLAPQSEIAVRNALRWIKRQAHGPKWFGRWFTHYLYGTCHVLEAFRALGIDDSEHAFQAATNWIQSVANKDGGFGEDPMSGKRKQYIGAASTPFHTACALIGLVHGGRAHHSSATRAASWLLDNQKEDGSWENKDFFAAGVPGLWYASFPYTPTYFAVKSLLLYRNAKE